MIVKNLPKKLRQLAMYRSRQQFKYIEYDVMGFYRNYRIEMSLCCLFEWSKTPEGSEFWASVNVGKITELPK